MICFSFGRKGDAYNNVCEIFDGWKSYTSFNATEGHFDAALGYYDGKPTAIGGLNYPSSNRGYSETLTEEGWVEITRHPMYFKNTLKITVIN